jgi:hypothetical protein
VEEEEVYFNELKNFTYFQTEYMEFEGNNFTSGDFGGGKYTIP